MTATVTDLTKVRKTRQMKNDIAQMVENTINHAVDILNASDEQINALIQEFPPEYREYVETGNPDAIRRKFLERGMDDSDFSFMAEWAVGMTNIAIRKNELDLEDDA